MVTLQMASTSRNVYNMHKVLLSMALQWIQCRIYGEYITITEREYNGSSTILQSFTHGMSTIYTSLCVTAVSRL